MTIGYLLRLFLGPRREVAYVVANGQRYTGTRNQLSQSVGSLAEQDLWKGPVTIRTCSPHKLGDARPISDLVAQLQAGNRPYWR